MGFSDFNHFDRVVMRSAAKWVQPEHYEIVGSVLAATRQRANLTQVQLAKRLRKPQSVVSAIEAGTRRVDLVEFLVIVRALDADPVEVFTEIVASVARDVG
jgi:transcriptional regulator with XRE-family HTH domain